MNVKMVWITPKAEELIVYMARVSNPTSQAEGNNPGRLLSYLKKHNHWSPFEMVGACFEIETTRDIGRQILRHRSFSFQEFSQRYADTDKLNYRPREARLQDVNNRQSSLETDNAPLEQWWNLHQRNILTHASAVYKEALELGIAKEQARVVLPEGLTPSRMYMAGTIRSWIHYTQVRSGLDTQKEHRDIAIAIRDVLKVEMPNVFTS